MKQPHTKKPLFTLEKWGNFGVFQSGDSLPIHFLLTTLTVGEMGNLTLARGIRPQKLDFELLMQRDLDVDRVNREIVTYLAPDAAKSSGDILCRPLFFPPLLVAVIPVVNKLIQKHLPDETVEELDLFERPGVVRSWGDIVKLSYFQNDSQSGISFVDSTGKTLYCDLDPVQIQVRRPQANSGVVGAELVVFDGQHRYEALRILAERGALKSLSIPICIVLSPNSTDKKAGENSNATLPVPEVFRTLFVDVNKNAVAVGGHFNTLLSDSSVGSIACRIFCESVLNDRGEKGLAVVEWNIRAKKDSTQIKRPYSITSIGVIEQGLIKTLSHKRDQWSLLKYVLALEEVSDELYPANKDSETEPEKVEWDRFSPNQRRVLEGQIRKRLVKQGLERIFFEAGEFRRAAEVFNEVVAEWQTAIDKNQPGYEFNAAVLQEVLEYVPISENAKAQRAHVVVFERAVEGKLSTRINSIVRYGIFQRAMISAWMALISRLRGVSDFDFNSITSGFIVVLDWVLDRERRVFLEKDRAYMFHAVFRTSSQIKPTDTTREALTSLILGALGNKSVASRFVEAALGKKVPGYEATLTEMGLNAATRFAGIYRKERVAEFSRSYKSDFSIPRDERESLGKLEEAVADLKRRVREKTADVTEYKNALNSFEGEVGLRVGKDVDLALADLRSALSYDAAVIEAGDIEELESEDS